MPERRSRSTWVWVLIPLALLLLPGCPGGEDGEDGTATTEPPTTEPPPSTAVNVRREVNTFSAADIDAYRKGVALMQSRANDDPTGWIYQANMHDIPTSNAICAVTPGAQQPAWATCQHGNFFFLAWHRMYLYYFERILRAAVREATGDPNYEFNLPYWDYENPNNHDLPEAFRNPGNNTNPLFVSRRAAACNSGGECVSAAEASDDDAMSLLPFCNCPDGETCPGCPSGLLPDETFGSQWASAPEHYGDGTGELEIQPHGVVHNAVGGPTGWMAYLECAARDPIFWLHHANIDRLWQVWLNQGGGRANPLGSDEWKDQTFTFFDENKTAVTMTACQVLNMATQLDYQYEGLPVENVVLCDAPPSAAPTTPPAPAKTLVSGPAAQTQLGRTPASVAVAVPKAASDRMLAVAGPEAPGQLRLVIEGLRLLRQGVHYGVYLNLPEGATPDPESPNFVGYVAVFSHPEHATSVTRSFDINDEVQALRQAGQWSGEVKVTFVPGHEPDALAAAPGGAQPFLSFRRVSIRERP
jgi:tyrosinase